MSDSHLRQRSPVHVSATDENVFLVHHPELGVQDTVRQLGQVHFTNDSTWEKQNQTHTHHTITTSKEADYLKRSRVVTHKIEVGGSSVVFT